MRVSYISDEVTATEESVSRACDSRSMESVIPDGRYCLVRFKAPQLKNDMVDVFQLHGAEDPEMGGSFTVKRLKFSTRTDPMKGLQRLATLIPENPA